MNRRTVARRVGKDIANIGAIPQGNRNAPKVQDAANDQVTVNPPVMTDAKVREALLLMDQAINTKLNPSRLKLTWRLHLEINMLVLWLVV